MLSSKHKTPARLSALVLGVIALGATVLPTKVALALDQQSWEANWTSLLREFRTSVNDFAREEALSALESFATTPEPGTPLRRWTGHLLLLRSGKDSSGTVWVAGRMNLGDNATSNTHVLDFYAPLDSLSPSDQTVLPTLPENHLVRIDGVVESATPVLPEGSSAKPRPTKADQLGGDWQVLRRWFLPPQEQPPPTGALGSSAIATELLQTDPKFAARLPQRVWIAVQLSHIDYVDLAQERAPLIQQIDAAFDAIGDADRLYQKLTSDSPEYGVKVGEGLIGRVRSSITCDRFLTLIDYRPCPEFLQHARAVGIGCPEKASPSASQGNLWSPDSYQSERDRHYAALQALRDKSSTKRFPEVSSAAVQDAKTWANSTAATMSVAIAHYEQILECHNKEAQKWEPAEGDTQQPEPERLFADATIEPPYELSWADLAPGLTPSLATQGFQPKQPKDFYEKCGLTLPSGWQLHSFIGPSLADREAFVFLVTDPEGNLRAVRTVVFFSNWKTSKFFAQNFSQDVDAFSKSIQHILTAKYGNPLSEASDSLARRGYDITRNARTYAWADSLGGTLTLGHRAFNERPDSSIQFPSIAVVVDYFHRDYLKTLSASNASKF